VIATLALAGPRVTELCQLNVDDVDLAKARFYINDSKTPAGIRDVDIHTRLLDELTRHAQHRPPPRDRARAPRASQIRATQEQPPIRAHVTHHTFRRTYIT
jgi:integrase